MLLSGPFHRLLINQEYLSNRIYWYKEDRPSDDVVSGPIESFPRFVLAVDVKYEDKAMSVLCTLELVAIEDCDQEAVRLVVNYDKRLEAQL